MKLAADAMKELGDAYKVADADQARHYLMRLQPQHAEMVATLLNEESTKPLPATLAAAAYAKTVSWVKAASRQSAMMDDRRVPTAYLAEEDEGGLEESMTYLHEESAVEDYLCVTIV